MMSSDEEAQQDEMLAMESIFDGDTFHVHPGDIRSGQIKIKLDLPDPFHVTVENVETEVESTTEDDETKAEPTGGVGGRNDEAKYKVQFLPPLTLHFTLPKNYPSQAKPNFTLSSLWLHRASLSVLCRKLDALWEENKGMGVLFTWANYLQANTLIDLGIPDYYEVTWLHRPVNLSKRNNFRPGRKRGSLADNDSTIDENHEDPPTEPATATPTPQSSTASSTPAVPGCLNEAASSKSQSNKDSKKRRNKPLKKKTMIDQRAASDQIPRKDGKEISLLDYLLLFNEEQIKETFSQSNHSCDICFTIKNGHSCVRFRCGHVFCEDCVSGYFTTNITEGNVDLVKCLAFNCKMRPTPELVKQLVGVEQYERYDEILLKRALENMSDVIYCPRPKCHNPVICDPNEKCAFCTVCSYTFCRTCKMVYHGVEPCRFKDAEMKNVYKKFTEGTSEEKKALLKAYGEKQLKVLVENVLSEQWIQKESKQCPHCKVPIEKFEGCNKVTCYKCNTYFCWICLKQLDHGNPYFHFNDPNSKCYNNLFQDVNVDGMNHGWFVGGGDDGDGDTSDDDDEDFDDLDFEGSDFEDFDDYYNYD